MDLHTNPVSLDTDLVIALYLNDKPTMMPNISSYVPRHNLIEVNFALGNVSHAMRLWGRICCFQVVRIKPRHTHHYQ